MEHVSALRDLGRAHLLIADGTNVIVSLYLLLGGVLQTVDLADGRPPLHEGGPSVPRLAPDVEVSVNQHHDGPDSAATLEYQDPAAIEEEEDSKEELNSVTDSPEMIKI